MRRTPKKRTNLKGRRRIKETSDIPPQITEAISGGPAVPPSHVPYLQAAKGWVSIREAAEVLGVSPRTVRRMVVAGVLPSKMNRGLRLVRLGGGEDTPPGGNAAVHDPALLSGLLDVYEAFLALLETGVKIVRTEKGLGHLLGDLLNQEGRPGFQEWGEICLRVKSCLDNADRLVQEMTPNIGALQKLYRESLGIRHVWAGYSEWIEEDSTECTFRGEGLVLLERIIGHLRALLVGSPV